MLGLISLGFFFLVPLLIEQLSTLVRTTPRIANSANQLLLDVINALNERQLVLPTPRSLAEGWSQTSSTAPRTLPRTC